MLKKILLPFLLITSFICLTTPATQAQKKQKQQNTSQVADDVFRLVNKHRTGMGLKPFTQSAIIAGVAEKHSRNMASKRVAFGHDGFDERMNGLEKKIKNTRASAENVAYTSGDAKQVVDMWLKSHDHRENIEGNYNLSGLGIAKGANGQIYYTQIFIKN